VCVCACVCVCVYDWRANVSNRALLCVLVYICVYVCMRVRVCEANSHTHVRPIHSEQNCQELKRERHREILSIWILHTSALSIQTDHGRRGGRGGGKRERERGRLVSEKESKRAKEKESERCCKCQAIYIHIHIYMCVCVCVCAHTHTHTHTNTHRHTHTHIHTHSHTNEYKRVVIRIRRASRADEQERNKLSRDQPGQNERSTADE